jgi:peroxisomal 2,4-dienoyl-CoA reductase
VLFITGGAGTIGSAQTRALVHLGADACIVGRNTEKTEAAAREIAKVRNGARVIGIGGVDVRDVSDLDKSVVHIINPLLTDNTSSTPSKQQQTAA